MQSHKPTHRDYVYEVGCKAKGRMQFMEIANGKDIVKRTDWHDNMILDSGLDQISSNSWANMIKVMKWGDDGTATNSSMTNLQNELGRSVTVTSYDFGDGYKGRDVILDPANGLVTLRQSIDSSVFGSTTTVREVGFGWANATGNNVFSRVVPSGGFIVNSGNQFRGVYELTIQVPGISALQTTETGDATGWPVEYSVTDITSTPTYFTVTTSVNHHYVSGGKINIAGTTNYNGEFTISSIPAANQIRVLDANNFSGEATGTVKNNVRRKFVAVKYSLSSHFRLDSGWTNPNGANLGRYFGCNSQGSNTSALGGIDAINADDSYRGFFDGAASSSYYHALNIKNTVLVNPPTNFPSHWTQTIAYHLGGTQTGRTDMASGISAFTDANGAGVIGQTYTPGSFYRDYVYTIPTAVKNFSNINCIILSKGDSFIGSNQEPSGYIVFEELQRKLSTHQLVITIRRIWGRL